MYIILKPKLLKLTKETAKVITIIISGFLLILAMIFIKYKPVYEVTVAGENIGYIAQIDDFKNLIEEEILNVQGECIEDVSLIEEPQFKLKLLNRKISLDENELIEKIRLSNTVITYKYYEVALNNETKSYVKTLEEAEKIVNEIKEEFAGDDLELNLQINEKYTENMDKIETNSIEVGAANVEAAAKEIKEESETIATVNNIRISVLPVTGRITSRYGESCSLRR